MIANEKDVITAMGNDPEIGALALKFVVDTAPYKYSYGFSWLGRPIIQFPQDMVALQEVIWEVQPQLIIETGIAHGGSLILSASILEMIGKPATVVGIDIDIRDHNRSEIEKHPMSRRISMIEGSSVDPEVVDQVQALAKGKERVLVLLDSNHTHDHVLQELEAYSPLVRQGSYVIVYDTVVEDMPEDAFEGRPWSRGNNPKTAVREFLSKNDRFEIDADLENKLLITVAPSGYLRCVRG